MKVRNTRDAEIMAVDCGGSTIRAWNGCGEVTSIAKTADVASADAFVGLLRKLVEQCPGARAVALALPMTIRYKRGRRRFGRFQTKYTWWAGRDVGRVESRLQTALHLPVFIEQDGHLGALYQAAKGPAKDADSSITVLLGTSISAGCVFFGRLFTGQMTSQISHVVVEPAGEPCAGHNGCLKTLIGKEAREKLSRLKALPPNTQDVYRLAKRGDKKAVAFFKTLAERLADGLAKVLRTLPVECIVVGGGVAMAGNLLLEPLRRALESKLDSEFDVHLCRSAEKEPVVKGAAIYGRERLAS